MTATVSLRPLALAAALVSLHAAAQEAETRLPTVHVTATAPDDNA
ncbi:hypothetical protein IP92_01656 [Pseudoduganella flava]|uniref:TonB-dependent receptor n=1 Tax=Pseudoduganella flava TaxID=871742 RepID=A0A562Q181_9BURK|nr:hypothetical protein IP92_01656 [Pseudoduganella flava]